MLSDTKKMFESILPCDTEKPYAFVSYSHADGEYVWQDVLTLQRKGYNIWIDRTVNPTEERSWNEATTAVISSFNCKLVLFYTSIHSLSSVPCRKEMEACESKEAIDAHQRSSVPRVKIDVNPIHSIMHLEKDANDYIASKKELSESDRSEKGSAVSYIMDHCFPKGNDTIRELSRDDRRRETDYYTRLEEILSTKKVFPSNPKERFEQCFALLPNKSAYRSILQQLEWLFEDNDPDVGAYAGFFLAYLYYTGLCGIQDSSKSDTCLFFAERTIPQDELLARAEAHKDQKELEKASALYLAHGICCQDAEGFIRTGKIWTKKGTEVYYSFIKDCLTQADRLGYPNSRKLLDGLEKYIALHKK